MRLVEPGGLEFGSARAARDPLMSEQRDEALRLGVRPRSHEDAQAVAPPMDDPTHERRQRGRFSSRRARGLDGTREVVVVAGREIHGRAHALVDGETFIAQAAGHGRALKRHQTTGREGRSNLGLIAIERGRGEMRTGGTSGRRVRFGPNAIVAQCPRQRGRIVEKDDGVRGHVIQQGVELVVVGWEERVRTEECASADDIVDERSGLGCRPIDRFGEGSHLLTSARNRAAIDDDLSRGRKQQLGPLRHILVRRLVGRVERLDRQNEIAVELDPERHVARGRPHIEDRAAQRKTAGVLDDRHPKIPGLGQPCDERIALELLLGDDSRGRTRNFAPRHHAPNKSVRRHDEHAPAESLRQPKERRRATHGCPAIRIHVGVGRKLACGEDQNVAWLVRVVRPCSSHKESNVRRDSPRLFDVLGHDHGASSLPCDTSHDDCSRCALDSDNVEAARIPFESAGQDIAHARHDHALGRQNRAERLEGFVAIHGHRELLRGDAGLLFERGRERGGARHGRGDGYFRPASSSMAGAIEANLLHRARELSVP